MPELPEVESARAVIERRALGRKIVEVDDSDSYVCRPHAPGEIRAALLGRKLTVAHRRGKSMWVETSASEHRTRTDRGVERVGSAAGRSRTPGPTLGIHLGMSGKIVIADTDGTETDGGDYWERGRAKGDFRFRRFELTFADGGSMLLIDPRRLGRVRLDPPVEKLGPDAAAITPAEFRNAFSRGTAPLKARLLDQESIAGVGNLLADQILWAAKLNPKVRVDELTRAETDRLQRATKKAVADAIKGGGVHTLSVIPYRKAGASCPRDGAPMVRGTVGGRTTWWCSREQA